MKSQIQDARASLDEQEMNIRDSIETYDKEILNQSHGANADGLGVTLDMHDRTAKSMLIEDNRNGRQRNRSAEGSGQAKRSQGGGSQGGSRQKSQASGG